jgi:nucleoside-triphosphatase THEP1
VDLCSGERRILARADRDLGGSTVGPYSFSQSAMEWAVGVIETAMHPIETAAGDWPACDLVIVDEIGKLELWQGTGLAHILPRLTAGEATHSLVLVRDSLLSELRRRLEPVEPIVFSVSEENRGGLAIQILQDLYDPAYPTEG